LDQEGELVFGVLADASRRRFTVRAIWTALKRALHDWMEADFYGEAGDVPVYQAARNIYDPDGKLPRRALERGRQ
jgi:hypothetical protein